MAEQQGVSKSTINNTWRSHNPKPQRSETFKLSRDARFLEKLTDVVSLYLNPPQQDMVFLCVDERATFKRWIARGRDCHEKGTMRNNDP